MRCHNEGFEKEARLREIHHDVSQVQESLYMFRKFMEVASIINPDLYRDAFKRRPCRRRLRYIGHDDWPEPQRSQLNAEGDDFFECGGVYFSIDFNGATYSIENYHNRDGNRPRYIGCAYFEWLADDE